MIVELERSSSRRVNGWASVTTMNRSFCFRSPADRALCLRWRGSGAGVVDFYIEPEVKLEKLSLAT